MHSLSLRSCTAALIAAAACATAGAHVVLEYQVAPAGGSYKATFKISHGCGASPTRQISVAIPPGVRGAKPMPKPGWTLEVTREKLAQPYTNHGRTVTEDVSRITWTARTRDDMLPNGHYDEFVLAAQLPREAGTLWWPVQQVCEEGRWDWTEVPRPGQSTTDLKAPAPMLEVMPSGSSSEHKH
jgi:uncharacterized protein YcnI